MRRYPVAALLWLLALCLAGPAAAQTFPAFTGLVVDNANILPPDVEASLTAKLAAFQQRTHRQLVIATIADTGGLEVADYGYRLGRTWGVGLRDVDNGVVLFAAPNNPAGHRGPRIEVGRRLEPVMTDAFASVIVSTQMMPKIRAGDVPGAFVAGTDAIIQQLSLPDPEAQARVAAAEATFDKTHKRSVANDDGLPLGLVFWGLVAAFVLLSLMRRGGGQRYRSGGGGSNWPIVLWGLSELGRGNGGGGGWGSGGGFGGGGSSSSGPDGSWGGGGFTGGGGGDFGGGGASGDW